MKIHARSFSRAFVKTKQSFPTVFTIRDYLFVLCRSVLFCRRKYTSGFAFQKTKTSKRNPIEIIHNKIYKMPLKGCLFVLFPATHVPAILSRIIWPRGAKLSSLFGSLFSAFLYLCVCVRGRGIADKQRVLRAGTRSQKIKYVVKK